MDLFKYIIKFSYIQNTLHNNKNMRIFFLDHILIKSKVHN